MNRSHTFVLLVLAVLAIVASGCAASRIGPYTPQSDADRHPAEAERLNQEAAMCMDSDPAKAETLLRESLTADLYCGPAHNNLGVIELERGRIYEAAGEFEWARRLMPGHPDPRMNLALALESAGRTDEAISTYRTALEVYPNHLPTMQALTRLQLRAGKTDDQTRAMLDEVAMRGETQRWREWARMQLTKTSP